MIGALGAISVGTSRPKPAVAQDGVHRLMRECGWHVVLWPEQHRALGTRRGIKGIGVLNKRGICWVLVKCLHKGAPLR